MMNYFLVLPQELVEKGHDMTSFCFRGSIIGGKVAAGVAS